METKQCRQCGEIKPIEQFRKYYGGRKGTYTVCKACEKINSRAKYLRNKGESMNYAEESELFKIEQLYDAQRACGLRPPRSDDHRGTKLIDNLDEMISNYKTMANSIVDLPGTIATLPKELREWLAVDLVLTEEPDYYLDEVYEDLKAKYRPVLRIDQDTMLPVYDETYRAALDKILDRFNEYEDRYYDEN